MTIAMVIEYVDLPVASHVLTAISRLEGIRGNALGVDR